MFCTNCGARAQPLAKFCAECGAPLIAAAAAVPEASSAPAQTALALDPPGPQSPPVAAPTAAKRNPHPWRRYFAKMVDLPLIGAPLLFLAAYALGRGDPELAATIAPAANNLVVGSALMVLAWIIGETILLGVLGTTPARALFGIRLRSTSGARLSWTQASQRTAVLAVVGLAFSIPLIAAITVLLAYFRLQNTGSTYWDDFAATHVEHAQWGIVRAAACVIVVLATAIILVTVQHG